MLTELHKDMLDEIERLKAAQPAVQDLPFGVGGGLAAIKTLLSRDPCVHANTAIEMIDVILKGHPAAQPAVPLTPAWIKALAKEVSETPETDFEMIELVVRKVEAEHGITVAPEKGGVK
jgi:hypothetical protein